MNNYIACCGLNCETCDARIATINDDNELRNKVAKERNYETCGKCGDLMSCEKIKVIIDNNKEVLNNLMQLLVFRV